MVSDAMSPTIKLPKFFPRRPWLVFGTLFCFSLFVLLLWLVDIFWLVEGKGDCEGGN